MQRTDHPWDAAQRADQHDDDRPDTSPADTTDTEETDTEETDTDRTDTEQTDTEQADTTVRADADQLDSDRLDSDRLDSDRLDSDRLDSDRLDTDRDADATPATEARHSMDDAPVQETVSADGGLPGAKETGPEPLRTIPGDEAVAADKTAVGVAEVPSKAEPEAGEPVEAPAAAVIPAQRKADEATAPLLGERAADYRNRWHEVQASFVDNPAVAVRSAEELVSEVVSSLSASLTERQRALSDEWHDMPDMATEDLRGEIVRYRTFFERLIAV